MRLPQGGRVYYIRTVRVEEPSEYVRDNLVQYGYWGGLRAKTRVTCYSPRL